MSSRAVVILSILAVFQLGPASRSHAQDPGDEAGCCRGSNGEQPPRPPGPGAGAGDHGGGTSVYAWVIGEPGGGVQAPPGTTCTPWRHAADNSAEADVADVGTVGVDPDGVRRNLYFRVCGTTLQQVWIRDEPPETLATVALSDLGHRVIDAPEPELSPPTVGYVNLETWLATTNPGPLTATASIPTLSVTATATVESTTWTTGDTGDEITCDGVGVAWTPGTPDDREAPCGHTYTAHGSPLLDSEPFTITVTHTWHVTWQASNGESGDLGTIAGPTTTITYEVREIQTIGIRG